MNSLVSRVPSVFLLTVLRVQFLCLWPCCKIAISHSYFRYGKERNAKEHGIVSILGKPDFLEVPNRYPSHLQGGREMSIFQMTVIPEKYSVALKPVHLKKEDRVEIQEGICQLNCLRIQLDVYFSSQSITVIISILVSSIRKKILIHIQVSISGIFEKQKKIHESSEKSTKLTQKCKVAPN